MLAVRHPDDFSWQKSAAPEDGSLLSNRDGAIMSLTRSNRDEPSLREIGIDIELFIAGSRPLSIRNDPHLHESHVLVGAGIHFRMPDTGTGTHALGESRVENPLVAF